MYCNVFHSCCILICSNSIFRRLAMFPGEPGHFGTFVLGAQTHAFGESAVFLPQPDEPDLIGFQFPLVSQFLVNQDLPLLITDGPFNLPLSLGGFVQGIMLSIKSDTSFILLPHLLQLLRGILGLIVQSRTHDLLRTYDVSSA